MAKSIYIYGPSGCGKSTNARRLMEYFGLTTLVDDWYKGDQRKPAAEGVLILGTERRGPLGLRMMSYTEASKEASIKTKGNFVMEKSKGTTRKDLFPGAPDSKATATNILKKIKDLDNGINSQERERKKQYDLLLKSHAPVKSGDVVKVNSGGSHLGKSLTVKRVTIRDGYFVAVGPVNRADGSPGAFEGIHKVELKAAK